MPAPTPQLVAGLAPLRGSQFFSGHVDVATLVVVALGLVLYLHGVRRLARHHPQHPWPLGRTLAWVGGLAVASLSVFSFIGLYDVELFWDHMAQHLLLIMVAAPLLAIGSPLDLAFRSTTGRTHRRVRSALRHPIAAFLGNPLVAFALYAVFVPLTHLTQLYNDTLVHPWLENGEHLGFLLVGYLFWRQIFGSDPNKFRMHPGMQFVYLFLAIPIDTFTGLSLNGETHEVFPALQAMHRNWGPSLVTDLHLGGTIMWVVGDTLMLWPMIPVALRWMHMEERKAVRVDRDLATQDERSGPSGVTIPPWVRPAPGASEPPASPTG